MWSTPRFASTLDVLYKAPAAPYLGEYHRRYLMQRAGAAKSGIPHHKAGVILGDMGPFSDGTRYLGGSIVHVTYYVLYEHDGVLSAIITINALPALRCLVLSWPLMG
jgi:hypothetical protein